VKPVATKKVYRSAETGQFVKQAEVKKHPKTTVTETVKVNAPKKSK
jgi:hypothetical protein